MILPKKDVCKWANDYAQSPLSFRQALDYLLIDKDVPVVVPSKTYGGQHSIWQIISNKLPPEKMPEIGKGERPVIMRGAWLMMVERCAKENGNYSVFPKEIAARYLRRYDISIISEKEAERVWMRLRKLMYESGKTKRRDYARGREKVSPRELFTSHQRGTSIYLEGDKIYLSDDEWRIVKSLIRNKRKLGNHIKTIKKLYGENHG